MSLPKGPTATRASFGSVLAICSSLFGCSLTEESFEPPGIAPSNEVAAIGNQNHDPSSEATEVAASELQQDDGAPSFSEDSMQLSLTGSTPSDEPSASSSPSNESPATDTQLSPQQAAEAPNTSGNSQTETTNTCSDARQNGSETDVDCGGQCPVRCAEGLGCEETTDCQIGECSPEGLCLANACEDSIQNQDETAVDCGGSCAATCEVGSACLIDGDCQTGVCDLQQCTGDSALCCQAPRCDDSVQNGEEGDVDCGGDDPACQRCSDGRTCQQASDCGNNNCLNGRCISCGSGTIDGTETDVDCGGGDPACQRCRPGQRCAINSDCQDNSCFGGFC